MTSRFESAHVYSLTRAPAAMPRAADCLRVDRVALGSLAASIGILASDQLVEVDHAKAAELTPNLSEHFAERRSYLFYSPATQESIALEASGIPLGLELTQTAQSLAAVFDPSNFDPEELYGLWLQGEFATLGRLSQRVVADRAPRGLMSRWRGKEPSERNTPALVLLGAALYERGDRDRARTLFQEFDSEYVSYWTRNYAGMLDYYAARDSREAGELGAALDLAWQAHEQCCCDRTAALVGELSGETPPRTPKLWVSQRYPAPYALPLLDERGRAGEELGDLERVLDSMSEGQIFLVCLLATYRGNGPYNDFMRRFRSYGAFFRDHLRGLHVVTMERERRADRPYWYEAEDACRGAGLPFDVLIDPDGERTMALEPNASPYVLALDRHGVVLEEGELGEVDFWVALGRAGHRG